MKGQWRKILEAYKNNPEALESKITKSEDTVIHIAIYVGQTHFVTSLLDNIKKEGNTPLHLAAELGNVEICTSIARLDANLISCRNSDGETPFFLAAHHGKKDAFFCLYAYLNNKQDHSLCRRRNGDTILHSTIFGECFG
ncbi:Serine/threonine-protein phosphatase 6 regulatory ankyrin repeat subunit A [Senna tora]|uniref:Serine/threonine-protein phosphatase 6 regulatory ankyrin repeat subunit A n=1 Tax=Senna tora TaxID=362788 RepID=A0A834X2N7_9FABA|nr:Serine/threonine-protein phosphatase 6 regulatory ankyrin repeat subunit A [Senna tora]